MSNVKIRDKDGAYKTYTDINEIWVLDEKEGQRVFVTPPSQKYFLLSGATIPQEVLIVGQTTYGPTTDLRTPFKVGVRKLDFGTKFSFVVEFDKTVQTEGLNFVDGAKSFQLVFSEEAVEGKLVTGWNFLQINEGGEILSSNVIEVPGNISISVPQPFVINSTTTLYNFLIPDGLEDKEITVIENGTQEILPTEGKLGIRKATIKTEVPLLVPNLQEKKIVLGADAPEIVSFNEGYDGLSKVSFDINGAVIAPENIAEGISILGVPGEHKGGAGSGYTVANIAEKTMTGEIRSNIVTEVKPYAFYEQKGITNVVLPNLTTIGERGFKDSGITEIYSPFLTKIGEAGFQGCKNLRTIKMTEGQSGTNADDIIGSYAFDGCENLEAVPKQGVRGVATYRNCKKITEAYILVQEDGNYNETATISPGESVFEGCSSLKTIKYLKGSEEIEDGVKFKGFSRKLFYGCSSLLSLPKMQPALIDDTGIEDYACYHCSSLTEIDVVVAFANDNSGKDGHLSYEIGDYAFSDCTSLKTAIIEVMFPADTNDSTTYSRFKIGPYAFVNCNSLTSLYIKRYNSSTNNRLKTSINSTSFQNVNPNLKIYVPSSLVSFFKSNWSTMSSKIYADPTEGT